MHSIPAVGGEENVALALTPAIKGVRRCGLRPAARPPFCRRNESRPVSSM
jgi:hypothetical protein